jgi:LysR family nitrogen assimilation transcriptional regulator
LTILEASSGHLHQYLADSIVDLAVVLHNPNSKKINTKKIFTEPLFLVMRHDHPLSNEQNISRENLDSIKDLILPAALHGTRFVIERYLQDGNIDLDSTIRTDSVSLMRGLISQGRGCALLPYMACPDRLRTGEFVAKPMRPILQRTLYLARLRDRDLSQEAMAMEAEIFSVVEKNEIDEYWKADDG